MTFLYFSVFIYILFLHSNSQLFEFIYMSPLTYLLLFYKVGKIENNRISLHKTNTKYISEISVLFDIVDVFE